MRVHAAVIAAVLILMAGCGDSDSDSGAVSYTHLTLPTIYSV